jgi:2-phosphoglycolate phosphatase
MKRKVKTIVWDFDGVVINSGPDIAAAGNYMLRHFGMEELPDETIIGFIGGGAEPLVRRCLGDRADELFEEALPFFLDRYKAHHKERTVLYPGVREVLDHYHDAGKNMGVATNKVESFARGIMKHLDIEHYFDVIIGPESVTHRKPHPEAVNRTLDHFNTLPPDAVMVGDTAADILAGKAAGTATVGVTYGFAPREEVEGAEPDVLIDEARQMLDYIE